VDFAWLAFASFGVAAAATCFVAFTAEPSSIVRRPPVAT